MAGLVAEVVDAVEEACLAGTEAALREGGFVPRPQLHMFIENWNRPYVGYVGTRPYYGGADAVTAIIRLADAPAAIAATRIVLVWEAADLEASLNGPGDYPNGLAVVVASLSGGHALRWHPFDLQVVGVDATGWPIAVPEWARSSDIPDAALPPVMMAVLARWRSLDGNPDNVFTDLLVDDFGVQFVQR